MGHAIVVSMILYLEVHEGLDLGGVLRHDVRERLDRCLPTENPWAPSLKVADILRLRWCAVRDLPYVFGDKLGE